MFAGRVTLNLWDNETGYYNASTYYGEKEILAIGISYQTESVGTITDTSDPLNHIIVAEGVAGAGGGYEDAMSVDILLEKTLGPGTVTLDLAWSDYSGTAVAESGAALADGQAGSDDADSVSIFAGLLLNDAVNIGPLSGKPRPYIRWVSDGTRGDEFAVGLQYVIDGHKASVCIEYGDWDGTGLDGYGNPTDNSGSSIGIGAQFQF